MKAKMKGSMTVVHALTIVEIVQTLTCSVLAVMMECTYMKTDALMNVQMALHNRVVGVSQMDVQITVQNVMNGVIVQSVQMVTRPSLESVSQVLTKIVRQTSTSTMIAIKNSNVAIVLRIVPNALVLMSLIATSVQLAISLLHQGNVMVYVHLRPGCQVIPPCVCLVILAV